MAQRRIETHVIFGDIAFAFKYFLCIWRKTSSFFMENAHRVMSKAKLCGQLAMIRLVILGDFSWTDFPPSLRLLIKASSGCSTVVRPIFEFSSAEAKDYTAWMLIFAPRGTSDIATFRYLRNRPLFHPRTDFTPPSDRRDMRRLGPFGIQRKSLHYSARL
jgi:hypothetical protein